ncbi:MAG: nucleotidyltransferase domain-containing protein [Candidatus Udaeobacter sp.]
MYLTETQLDILRTWAEQTPQVQEAHLFGSYAKGEARADSDVDIAIRASAVDWTFRTAKWEECLTKAMGVKVNIRTLALPNVRRYCQEFSMPIKG